MESNIEILHKIDLEIVKEVVKICDKNNLIYYMSGGTLLGAIRHKGFIPWDDDIDLAMPREDYEKFLILANKELPSYLKVINFKTDKNYQYYITRINHLDTQVEEIRINNKNRYTNISIDIFPLDGTPNNKFCRSIYYFKVMFHRAIMSLCYPDSIDRERKRSKKEKLFLSLLEILHIEKIFDPYKEKCKIDKLMRKYKVENSKNIGCLMGAYRIKQIVPKDFFSEGEFYPFESISLRGPLKYDLYLKHMYGDYMKLPPENDRKVHFKNIELHGGSSIEKQNT